MGKKRKKSQQPQTTSAPSSQPSNEIQLADILESTPVASVTSNAQACASEEPKPVAVNVVAVAVAPEPPVSRPALTEEKAAELVATVESPAVVIQEAKTEPPAPVSEAAPPSETTEPPPASEAAPSTIAPKKKKKTKKRVSRATLDKKIDRLEAKLTEKKEEAAKAAREGFGSNPAIEDDTSVPPVDLEVHDAFFAAGEKEPPIKGESGAYSAIDARHAQKMTPHAHARRAHLSRYVMWAVSGAAAILLLGITIKTFRRHPNEEPVRREVTHVTQAAQQPTEQAAPENVVAPPPQVVEVNEVVDPKQDTVAEAADAKAPEPTETVEKKEDMPAETPKTAYQEKVAAKAALERGANSAAIAAGERSVALDASDGEAWLVLGGAYQAMGNNSQAKRCYNACVSQGKKGPISDCRDMLSSL